MPGSIVFQRPGATSETFHRPPAEIGAVPIDVGRPVTAILCDASIRNLEPVLERSQLVARIDSAKIKLAIARPFLSRECADLHPPMVLLPVHGHKARNLVRDTLRAGIVVYLVIGFSEEDVDHFFLDDPRESLALCLELLAQAIVAGALRVILRQDELLDEHPHRSRNKSFDAE